MPEPLTQLIFWDNNKYIPDYAVPDFFRVVDVDSAGAVPDLKVANKLELSSYTNSKYLNS